MRLIFLVTAICLSACSTVNSDGAMTERDIKNDYANNPDTEFTRIVVPTERGKAEYYFRPIAEFSTKMTLKGSEAARQCQAYALLEIADVKWLSSCEAALAEIDLAPVNRVATLYNKGLIQMKLGNSEVAEGAFERINQLDPNFAAGYFGLAVIAFNQFDYKAAIALAEKSIDLQFEHTHEAYNLIGYAQENNFDFDKARTAYRRALKVRPGASDVRRNLERLNRLWPEKPVRNFATEI